MAEQRQGKAMAVEEQDRARMLTEYHRFCGICEAGLPTRQPRFVVTVRRAA